MSWNFEVRNGIGILELDQPGTEVNVLSSDNLRALRANLDDIAGNKEVKALLITSAKKRIFIAGADINEIKQISTEQDAFDKAEQGKAIFKVLEDLKIPTITVINGACLGGGYELALSTNYRVASFSENVKIGLPEVNLGILPGFGGSIRLPRLIGLLKSMPLILAGKMLGPQDALKNGLVDKLFSEKTLKDDAIQYAEKIVSGDKSVRRKTKKKSLINKFLEDTGCGRSLAFKKAREGVMKKTKGVYPAPLAIIDLLEKTYRQSNVSQAFRHESEAFSKLGATEVSKNLIKLFFMSEKYKKFKWTNFDAKDWQVKKCGVIGAGVMGGGIAQRVAYKNIPVRVKDINEKALAGALAEASKIYQGALKRKRIKKYQYDYQMGLISVGLTDAGLKSCDVIVEAVVENLEIKKKVFKGLDDLTQGNTVLASNTSSLPVTEMAAATAHPDKVVGLHFFNPVDRMPLVEVIRGEKTSSETLEKVIQFARRLGKTVIVTKDAPGFLVNRLLLPYLNEAAYLMQEGVSPEVIDRIATEFGMPMGPVELVDQVGIDVGYKVAHILEDAFGARMKVCSILEDVNSKGLLGKKGSKGFYVYQGKEKSVNTELKLSDKEGAVSDADALKRMIYIMINEAARCLEEDVIDSPETVDIGMVMGTGFPPFRAGLLHYADSVGLNAIVTDLQRFAREIDAERFKPCDYLQKLAKEDHGFHSAEKAAVSN